MPAKENISGSPSAMVLGNAPSSGLQADVKCWQRIDWPACIQSRLYNDWGGYYARKLLNKKALECYGRALAVCKEAESGHLGTCTNVRPTSPAFERNCFEEDLDTCRNDFHALVKSSQCKRRMAHAESALQDARRAKQLVRWTNGNDRANVVLEECDAHYDNNQYEENLRSLHREALQFRGANITKRFQIRKDLTLGVFEDTIGDTLTPFMHKHWAAIREVARLKRQAEADSGLSRPLWKVLKEQSRCDVQSVLDKEVPFITPLERARRRVCNNVFNYQYLGKSAHDVAMLRALRNDDSFLNPLMHESTSYLRDFVGEQYQTVRKFMKMMHARSPLYNKEAQKCRGTNICEKNRENYLYRVQHQTRRDCFRLLREVRQLRRERNVEILTEYVNQIMSNYIALKTQRTLPWKLEFVHDVYNTLALAHTDRCSVPSKVDLLDPKNRALLYLLSMERNKGLSPNFGGPNMYIELAKEEERLNRVAQYIEQLEERLRYSRYPIERAYLFFEMARSHFKEFHYDKCMSMARKSILEARSCNSIIWRFNSTFLVCQVHAQLKRLERLKDSLLKACQLAEYLNSPKLMAYLKICCTVNDHELVLRKMRLNLENPMRRQRRVPNSTTMSLDSTASGTF